MGQLVEIRRWRSWPERGSGSGALDLVSVPQDFIIVVSLHTLLLRLQSNG